MRRWQRPSTAWAILAFGLITVTATYLLDRDGAGRLFGNPYLWAGVVITVVGMLLATKRPANPIGFLFLGFIALGPMEDLGLALAQFMIDRGATETAAWAETIGSALSTPAVIAVTAAFLLFPSGALPSNRWRIALWALAPTAVLGMAAALINGGWGGDISQTVLAPSPLREDYGAVGDVLSTLFFVSVSLLEVTAIASLIIRYRTSGPEQRLQLKWVALAAACLVLTIFVAIIGDDFGGIQPLRHAIIAAGLAAVPTGIGLAILNRRIYDIDIVISKTVTYGAIAVGITGTYVGIVVGVGRVAGSGTEFTLQVVAAIAIAIAFQPARRLAERWANRLVYGERASPYEVLARFTQRASSSSDADLLQRIPRIVVDGTAASQARLFVEADGRFRPAAVWPESADARPVAAEGAFLDAEADHSFSIVHDSEVLGGLSLTMARGEALNSDEAQLVADVASGIGLALRNARLTAQLRDHVAALEASRERVLAAADDARRDLERDLDSGPQQQLVALKVKLGPLRIMAERAEATKTAEVLQQLEVEAGDAIRAVRAFSSGVFPPLLEAEGLEVALRHRTQQAALPITVVAERVDRYSREVEAAIYFAVLEALQNMLKYADASSATVVLRDSGGELVFRVSDDGRGFDASRVDVGSGLANMADRLDAVGGTLSVESAPGQGTVVSGSAPAVVPTSV